MSRATIFILGVLLVAGCTTIVVPPVRPDPAATVFIVRYGGGHHSILLPGPDGLVEYSYGDWEFYAKSNRAWHRGILSLAIPSQATLGRQSLPWDGKDMKRLNELVGCAELTPVRVGRAEVNQLRSELDRRYERRLDSVIFNDKKGMHFVMCDPDYVIWRTCNHALAGWLVSLGCDVRGSNALGNYQIESDP